ncbi:MAG TPA: NosD domain-containing protein [Patescibacteria group bacterium]|nr:NosD domain-containing protein [Patescibacteria group bacterium]
MEKEMCLAITLALVVLFTILSSVPMGRTEPVEIVVPDDYLTIQEAIDNAVDGDTVFVKAGTYYEHVVVNKTLSLVGEDANTTVIDGNSTGHVVYIVSSHVSVTGFTVQKSGSVHSPALDAGICLNRTTDCIISGNRLMDDGFAGISVLDSLRNMITDNNVTRTGWGGIHLLNSSHNAISGNILHDNTIVGINGHASSHYNNITDNVVSNSSYGMFYHDANYNNICKNNISTIAVEGIWLQDQVSYNIVANNNLISCRVAIKLEGPNYNNTLSGNFITSAECGILILNARYTDIYDNTIAHNYGGEWDAGIRLDSAGYSRIHANFITDNWRGILLYSGSSYVSIYDNNITENEFGIRVASGGSNYLNVSDNVVMNNRGYGIGLTGFGGASNYATITRNLIENNSDGIALGQSSYYHTILQNNISQNGYGFYIDYSRLNTMCGNNIVDNDQQVYVSTGSVNNWDSAYSAGGNYWSDYAGADLFSGPVQNETGSDGIGDEACVIDTNNIDHYPLTKPYPCMPHDLGITQVPSSKTVIGQNYTTTLSSIIFNYGSYTETFNFSLCANSTHLMSEILTVGNRSFVSTTFIWNTSGLAFGNYTLLALADTVPGETDISDNNCTETVHVGIPGDVSGPEPGVYDKVVDMRDINYTILLFNTNSSSPNWKPNADINNDGTVNMRDIQIAILNFNKHE